MADPDSMFLFEIMVEELRSYINCREFCIRSQFADIFSMNLKDPNELGSFLPKRPTKMKLKRKSKIRTGKPSSDRHSITSKVQAGQSILFANSIDLLISNMKQYPMELSLWSKVIPDYKIGSTHIPWSSSYFDYLNKLHRKPDLPPVCVTGDYNVFDEFTSKRMAVIKLNIKLSYLRDSITTPFSSLSKENQQTCMCTDHNSTINNVLTTVKTKAVNMAEDTGVIKTIYSGGKHKYKKYTRDRKNNTKNDAKNIEERGYYDRISSFDFEKTDNRTISRKYYSCFVSLVKSDINISNIKQSAIIKAKSCSSINQENFNMLNYIFGGSPGPFGNKVYCVGYFTVENDFADSPRSESAKAESPKSESIKGDSHKSEGSPTADSPKSTGSPIAETPKYESSPPAETQSPGSPIVGSNKFVKLKETKPPTTAGSANDVAALGKITDRADEVKMKERYKFKICDSKCTVEKSDTGSCTQSVCSLDLPQEASNLITMKKCDKVVCNHRTMRKLPTPPDDRILLDLSNMKKDCCDVTEKLEEVVGGMKAKMKFGDDPCFCECECRFGFTKRTTYCNICGGYEVVGEDNTTRMGYDMSFPCPIFHKLAEKGKMKTLSTSGSETKKKDGRKTDKSAESDKDITKKGKKKKKDDRFKFNYGYTAPQIGHSRCAMPCTGTLGVVPKNMGWLWTAEDIPGIKVAQGWKPGAISNRLLRKLNKAKRQTLPEQRVKPTKKTKKRIEDKPTLIICKRNGEYRVEMQVSPEDSESNLDQRTPLVYKITREDNDERNQKRLRKQTRLVKKAVDKVWVDPYHPEICEKTCLRAYKQAVGLYDPDNAECTCSEEEEDDLCSCCNGEDDDNDDASSDCSSLDIDWEIHFSPPIAFQA